MGPNVIMSSEESESERFKAVTLLAFKKEEWAMRQKCGQPLEAGRVREMDSLLPGRYAALWTPSF